jgi:hypothetical protein
MRRMFYGLVAGIGLLLGLVAGAPAHATTVAPRPAVAESTTYTWSSAVQVPFKDTQGTTIATISVRWRIANNGTCRWIEQVQVGPSSFNVTYVHVWETLNGVTVGTGYVWDPLGTSAGWTSPALTVGAMNCIALNKIAYFNINISRDAGIARNASYKHTF